MKQSTGEGYAKSLMFSSLTLLMASGIAIALIYTLQFTKPEPTFLVRSVDNEYRKVSSLIQPSVSSDALLDWAILAITASYTIDFLNYKSIMENNRQYFTADGFQGYLAAFSNITQTIEEKALTISAIINGTPVILEEGIFKDKYTWNVQIPLLVTYQSASEDKSDNKVLNILITQVPTSDAPNGIGISRFTELATLGSF